MNEFIKQSLSPPPADSALPCLDAVDRDVIVTASAERTKVVAALARELGLPFVEFSFFFVKGDINDCGEESMPLTPVWLTVGGNTRRRV